MVARVCGMLAAKLHQPAVIGEMVAGILLGPSLLGWLWPDLFRFVFPTPSLGVLRLFSQIGVCLFACAKIAHCISGLTTACAISIKNVLSFGDAHAEHWRWLEGTTIVA